MNANNANNGAKYKYFGIRVVCVNCLLNFKFCQ